MSYNVSQLTQTTGKRVHESGSGENQLSKRPRLDSNGNNGHRFSVISPTNGQFNTPGNGFTPNIPTYVDPNYSQNLSTATITIPQQEFYALKAEAAHLRTIVVAMSDKVSSLDLRLNAVVQQQLMMPVSSPQSTSFASQSDLGTSQPNQFPPPDGVSFSDDFFTDHWYESVISSSPSVPDTSQSNPDASSISSPSTTTAIIPPHQANQFTTLDGVVSTRDGTPIVSLYQNAVTPDQSFTPLVQNLNVLEQTMKDQQILENVAQNLSNIGNYQAGIEYLKQDYLRDKNNINVNYWLGYFHMKLGNHLLADFYLGNIAKEHELYFKAQDAIAQSYIKQKKIDEAVYCLEKVLLIKKGSNPTSINAVRFHLGECYIKKRQYHNAKTILHKISKIDPLYNRAQGLIKKYKNETKQNKEAMGFGQFKNVIGKKRNAQ